MKYVLIETEGVGINVGIYPPKFFDTHELAHEKMCSQIAKIRKVSIEEIRCSGLVNKYCGWTEKDGKYYNFQIFEVLYESESV